MRFSKNVYPGSVYATPSQRHACVLWMPSTKIDSSSKGGCMKLSAIICAATLAVSLHAQGPTGFVDTFVVKVKPEKRADFDVIGKKIADANRRHKGSNWIAYQTEYGEQNTVSFSALADNYAGVEKSADAFGKAMMEAYGPT